VASTCSIINGSGIRNETASCLQSKTHELQCQHSSGYRISGTVPFSSIQKTSVGQISAQTAQALHFSLLMIGGMVSSFYKFCLNIIGVYFKQAITKQEIYFLIKQQL